MRDREGAAGETGGHMFHGQRISGMRVIRRNEPTGRGKHTESAKRPVGLEGAEHADRSKKLSRLGKQLEEPGEGEAGMEVDFSGGDFNCEREFEVLYKHTHKQTI